MRMKKTLLATAGVVGGLAWVARDLPAGFGARPSGARAERVRQSPQFRDGKFVNAGRTATEVPEGSPTSVPEEEERHRIRELFFDAERRKPHAPIPVVTREPAPEAGSLRITWYGHATALVEIDGRRVLIDPIWSDRCSPSRLVGPKRLHRPPIALDQLPPVDAIVISHDHYDHLDMTTIVELARRQDAPFLVPLGVGAHLEHWRIPADRIVELDWHESTTVADLRLTATPAQHFSGRTLTHRDYTLWSSWVITGPTRNVFYSGDTGYFPGFARIGTEYGPFDATLIQVGAYDTAWPDIHMMPEDGVATHVDVQGGQANHGVMIPVHWGTFTLAFHPWAEPIDRAWRAAKDRGVTLAVPRPGECVDIDDPPAVDGWWQSI